MKILFLSPEAVPFAKSGGLADVAGSLPVALHRLGMDVRLILPCYRTIKKSNLDRRPVLKDLEIPLGDQTLRADIYESSLGENIPVYMIDREDMYDRPGLYGSSAEDYYDNIERFSFYCHGSLAIAERLKYRPDIIHCHDWQTGIVPALIQGPYSARDVYSSTSTVFTIHNIGYQGLFPENKLPVTGLPHDGYYHPRGLEYWGNISLLKSGIVYADAITTVSPSYAKEIQTGEYGRGMEGVLTERISALHGILNGVDYDKWDPAKDTETVATYSPENMTGKQKCKEALLKEMGLASRLKDRPLLGVVSRLDFQKGIDLLIEILDKILGLDVGMVILGAGDRRLEDTLKSASDRNKTRLAVRFGLNEPLSHKIIAGSDMFLIPSRYEPCGLTQMYALKYGTIPVVRATGGLNDTIIAYDKKNKINGFKFAPPESGAFYTCLKQAVSAFDNKKTWNRLIINGMGADFSWDTSAKSYIEIYKSLVKSKNNVI